MARNRLIARDRMLLFGLGFGLVVGIAIGRKILSPLVVVFLAAMVFVAVWLALRVSREAREGTAHHRPILDEEEYVEA